VSNFVECVPWYNLNSFIKLTSRKDLLHGCWVLLVMAMSELKVLELSKYEMEFISAAVTTLIHVLTPSPICFHISAYQYPIYHFITSTTFPHYITYLHSFLIILENEILGFNIS